MSFLEVLEIQAKKKKEINKINKIPKEKMKARQGIHDLMDPIPVFVRTRECDRLKLEIHTVLGSSGPFGARYYTYI